MSRAPSVRSAHPNATARGWAIGCRDPSHVSARRREGTLNRMRHLTTTLLAAAALLLLPADALAAGGGASAVQDCQDGKIDGTYTAAEYRTALKSIPTDVDEYTDCRDVLRSAQLRAASAPPTSRSAAASAPPTPAAGAAAATPQAGSAPTPGGSPAPQASAQSAPAASAGAASGSAPVGTAPAQPSGTAPPPRIPGLPVDAGPVVAGGAQDESPLATATASRATEEVPPTLAFLLVLVAGGLLAFGALRARRTRHAD